MVERLLAIYRNTLMESIRQPIFLVMIGVGILALIFNLGISAFTLDDDNKFLVEMGLATILLCGLLISAFVATSVLTREIEDKTVLTVISKPVSRPVFILGKYLGVSTAILIATFILSVTFMLTVRHKVLQTATDEWDYPVVIFGTAAILLSVGFGVWCNFFYGKVFTSTTILALLPLSFAAWVAVLFVNRDWEFQHPMIDLNLLMIVAIFGLVLALLVICAVAIAASTRLGQVMTIFVCVLVFFLGLLSDHFFGRNAFIGQEVVGRIIDVEDGLDLDGDFSDEKDWYLLTIDKSIDLSEGLPLHICADSVTPSSIEIGAKRGSPAPTIVRNISGRKAEIVRVSDGAMRRPPRPDDFLLRELPEVRQTWRWIWAIPPNFQFLVLVDPITQAHIIPLNHMVMITLYAFLYITATLCLAVILFQTREVG